MNALLIRPCQSNDIPQILEIRKRTFSHFAPSAYSPKEVQTLLEDINVPELEEMIENKSLFVAEENHKIAGCGGWFGESVRHMYVSPEETKKGIGSALLRVLEEDYKNRTRNSIIKAGVILYARPFYEKNGYEFLKLDTDWDGSKFNRMQKKLG
jgi:ribosomal protein S18 acetylase RimI-like enzyme